jgi:uncharacterized protein (TIGR03790 family)
MKSSMKKRIIHLSLQLILVGAFVYASAQTSTYKDVLVVINSASGISDSVGNYFADIHNIPEQNIVRITAPTTEEIDSVQFENLRTQIESALISRNIKDSINYIVTTKGVPLKVHRWTPNANSSVESELTLILSPYASYIGKDGRLISPYYNQRQNFTRAKYGIYLVTRLDGYSYNDIKSLIDRSSSIPRSIPSGATFVLDQDPTYSTSMAYLNTYLSNAANSLRTRGQTLILDTTTVYLTHQTNVIGYVSWGSNDQNQQNYTSNAKPLNTYLPGAIAETYVSTSARSFVNPPSYGQSLAADLIAEGITAVKGYTYEPYSNAMSDANILLPMYVDGYTVAESYYAASYFLGWMDVVIGDPKFRLLPTRMPADTSTSQDSTSTHPLPVQLTSFTATAAKNSVHLNWHTASETNCYGFEVEKKTISGQQSTVSNQQWVKVGFVNGAGTSNSLHDYRFSDQILSNGRYAYRIKQIDNDGLFTYYGNIEVAVGVASKEFSLKGNYPNPFNPSTTIEFTLPENGQVTLKVYNAIGQHVATLFDGIAKAEQYNKVTFNASQLSSGIYFSILEFNNQRLVRKMMLTK